MKAINVITHLMSVLNLTPNKDLQSGGTQHISAYGSFPVGNDICIIRVADHNTFLYNWIDKNQHIDLTTSANYAITFVDEVPFHNNPNKDNIVNASNPPDVILRQYVYNVTALTDAEVTLVMDECIRLSQTGVFTDPLEEDDEKHAVIYRHRTNQPTEDMTNKTRKAHRKKKAVQNKKTISQTNNQPVTDNNKTNKNENKNMSKKNTIRLTESELKKVITESVMGILKEHEWYNENPNQGKFPDDLEIAIRKAYRAVDELFTLSNKYSQTMDDEYARRDADRIKDVTLSLMNSLHSYIPGKRMC